MIHYLKHPREVATQQGHTHTNTNTNTMDMTMVGAANITTVDCHKQVRSWRLLRSLFQLLIPTCNCSFLEDDHDDLKSHNYIHLPLLTSTVTGTVFGYRRGKVKFCIQPNPESTNPVLLLELPVPTSTLAKEMRGGTLRMALESATPGSYCNLLSTPLWNVHCNGRKMGYAVKRTPSNSDLEALSLMRSVVVGTGIIKHNELMYLRAKFRRVRGSSNSESFHLIDPEIEKDNAGKSKQGDVTEDREAYTFHFSHLSTFHLDLQPLKNVLIFCYSLPSSIYVFVYCSTIFNIALMGRTKEEEV